MLFQIILTIHILLSISLVVLILMQHGKGADAGAAFGSGASGAIFGARGSNDFVYRLTSTVALGFFLTSLSLAYLATNEAYINDDSKSVMNIQSIENPMQDTPFVNEEIIDIPN